MIFRARHLREDRLFDCYLAEQTGEPVEPPAAEHLADCPDCGARYADLRRFMDGLRSEADAELDDVFPADLLRVQQQHILGRLEHVAHPARVISFPGRAPDHPPASPRPHVALRWMGGAAAAGLLIGLGAGSFFYAGAPAADPAPIAAARTPASRPPATTARAAQAPPAVERSADINVLNEQFLSELEIALERPHTPELVVLDDLTPHVREVGVQLR